jgi:hypothetical protein
MLRQELLSKIPMGKIGFITGDEQIERPWPIVPFGRFGVKIRLQADNLFNLNCFETASPNRPLVQSLLEFLDGHPLSHSFTLDNGGNHCQLAGCGSCIQISHVLCRGDRLTIELRPGGGHKSEQDDQVINIPHAHRRFLLGSRICCNC